MIELADVPVAAPSANRFCAISPTTADHVRQQFGDRLPNVLDGGPAEVGVESTVLGFENGKPILLRPGGVTLEEIEALSAMWHFPMMKILIWKSPLAMHRRRQVLVN